MKRPSSGRLEDTHHERQRPLPRHHPDQPRQQHLKERAKKFWEIWFFHPGTLNERLQNKVIWSKLTASKRNTSTFPVFILRILFTVGGLRLLAQLAVRLMDLNPSDAGPPPRYRTPPLTRFSSTGHQLKPCRTWTVNKVNEWGNVI